MKKCVLLLLLLMALAACAPNERQQNGEEAGRGNISIVTTIFPLYDFARAVAGENASLAMLVKPGTEVHTYDPSPADIIRIQEADVFIYIGGEDDAWVKTILASMDTSHKKLIRLMDAVDVVEEETVPGMEADEGGQSGDVEYDSHIWTSPRNAILMVNAIADALGEADSGNADVYRANAVTYAAQIQALDDEIRTIVDAAPNKLLVFGDRFPFRYFTDEFGLDYRAAFNGCSTESEASAGTLAYLVETVMQNNIGYIYYIEFSNRNIARVICEQTGAQMLPLHSCNNVTGDEFEAGVTYVSLMAQNVESLRKGLGMDAAD